MEASPSKTILPARGDVTLSENLAYLKPSETVSINQETQRRKAAGEDVIDLSAGEPDFDTPKVAAESGIKAIQQGKTKYPPNVGLLDLRLSLGVIFFYRLVVLDLRHGLEVRILLETLLRRLRRYLLGPICPRHQDNFFQGSRIGGRAEQHVIKVRSI